jgi:hypothetical protein
VIEAGNGELIHFGRGDFEALTDAEYVLRGLFFFPFAMVVVREEE